MTPNEKRNDALTKFSQVMQAKEALVRAQEEYDKARDAFLKILNDAFPFENPVPPFRGSTGL